jgi:hypothetical protein
MSTAFHSSSAATHVTLLSPKRLRQTGRVPALTSPLTSRFTIISPSTGSRNESVGERNRQVAFYFTISQGRSKRQTDWSRFANSHSHAQQTAGDDGRRAERAAAAARASTTTGWEHRRTGRPEPLQARGGRGLEIPKNAVMI